MRIHRSSAAALTFVLLGLLASLPATAGCTATLNCNNSCSIFGYECPPPSSCILSCSAPSQTVSCSGTTTCTVGSNSVTCDGNTFTCSSQQCFNNGDFIQCGSTIRRCNSNCPK